MRATSLFLGALAICGALAVGCGGASVVERHDPGVVTLEGALGNSFVRAGTTSELVARVRVGTQPLGRGIRPPINLALVVDTSGSMEGEPIEDAREASLALLDSLAEGDRLAVVAFSSTSEVLLPSTELDEDNLHELRERIGRMEATGTTDMAGGLAAGLQEVVAQFDPQGINRVVLLGDGVPNDESGIPALAQAAGERGIAITALGLGIEYNETLMGQIAQLSGGRFHYIEESAQVAQVFRNEVLRLERVFGRNAVVQLQPGPGVRIDSVVGQSVAEAGGAVRVLLGELAEGEHRDVIVRLTVDGHREGASVELMDVHLTFDDAVSSAGTLERRVFLGARATADDQALSSGRNEEVEREAARVQAAAVTVEAIRVARGGELDRARAMLSEAEGRARAYADSTGDADVAAQASSMGVLRNALPSVAPGGAGQGVTLEEDEGAPASMPPEDGARRTREVHQDAMEVLGY